MELVIPIGAKASRNHRKLAAPLPRSYHSP